MGNMGSMCCCGVGFFDWWPLNYTDEVNPIPDSTVGLDVWDAITPKELVLRIPVIQIPLLDPAAALTEAGWDSGDLDTDNVLFLPGGLIGPTRHTSWEAYEAYGVGAAVIAEVATHLIAHAEPIDFHYNLGAVAWWHCGLPCRNGSAYLIFGMNPGSIVIKVNVSGAIVWSRYCSIGAPPTRWTYDGETTTADDRKGVVPIRRLADPDDRLMPIAYYPGPDFLVNVPVEYPPGSRIAENSTHVLLLEEPVLTFAQVDADDIQPFIGVPRAYLADEPYGDPFARMFRADGIWAGDTGFAGIPNSAACWGDDALVSIAFGVNNSSFDLFLGIETSYKLAGADGVLAIASVIVMEEALGPIDGQSQYDYTSSYTPNTPNLAGSFGTDYLAHDGVANLWGTADPAYRKETAPSPGAFPPGGGFSGTSGDGWDVYRKDWTWDDVYRPADFFADAEWPAWVETLDRIPCWVAPLDIIEGYLHPTDWTFTADTKSLPYVMPTLRTVDDFPAAIPLANRELLRDNHNDRIADLRESMRHGNYGGLAEPNNPRVVYYSLDDYPRVLTAYHDGWEHYIATYETGNIFAALEIPEPIYSASCTVKLCLGDHTTGNQGSGTTVLDEFDAVGPGPRVEVIAFMSRGTRYIAMWTYQQKHVDGDATYEWIVPEGEPAYWDVTQPTVTTDPYRLTILMGVGSSHYKELYYRMGLIVPGGYCVSLEDPTGASWAAIDAPGYGILAEDAGLGDLVLKRVAESPVELGTCIDALAVSNAAGTLFDHVVLCRRVYHEGLKYKTLRAEAHCYKNGVIVGIYTIPFTQEWDDDWEETEDVTDLWHANQKICVRGASDNWIYFSLGYSDEGGYMLNVNSGQMRATVMTKGHAHEYLAPEYECDGVLAHGISINSNLPTEGDLPDTL